MVKRVKFTLNVLYHKKKKWGKNEEANGKKISTTCFAEEHIWEKEISSLYSMMLW